MSGTVRAGLLFGIAAVFAFVVSLLLGVILPCINLLLGFAAIIALGWGAGYTAAKNTGAGPGQGAGRGATAGAIGGTVVLLGLMVAFLLLFNLPPVQAQIAQVYRETLQQNPELVTPGIDPTLVGSTAGLVFGFFCGIINFILMLIGGAIGGMMWKGSPGTTTTGTAEPTGGRPYHPPSSPGETSTPSSEGGVRIYDTDEPNRPR